MERKDDDAIIIQYHEKTIKRLEKRIEELLAQPAQEPVGEIRASSYGNYPVVAWVNGYVAKIGDKFYTPPPQRERVVFPTMLRKMWSGSEVQAWLDENVNKEKNT